MSLIHFVSRLIPHPGRTSRAGYKKFRVKVITGKMERESPTIRPISHCPCVTGAREGRSKRNSHKLAVFARFKNRSVAPSSPYKSFYGYFSEKPSPTASTAANSHFVIIFAHFFYSSAFPYKHHSCPYWLVHPTLRGPNRRRRCPSRIN